MFYGVDGPVVHHEAKLRYGARSVYYILDLLYLPLWILSGDGRAAKWETQQRIGGDGIVCDTETDIDPTNNNVITGKTFYDRTIVRQWQPIDK